MFFYLAYKTTIARQMSNNKIRDQPSRDNVKRVRKQILNLDVDSYHKYIGLLLADHHANSPALCYMLRPACKQAVVEGERVMIMACPKLIIIAHCGRGCVDLGGTLPRSALLQGARGRQ